MNFKEFLDLHESKNMDYHVINKYEPSPNLGYIPLGTKEARQAEEKFLKGRLKLKTFLQKQEVGFRAIINGEEYLRSIDGIFVKKTFPLSGHKGTAIGQRELYSPATKKRYTKILKDDPEYHTDPITVVGTPTEYRVIDGHHRTQAYKDAGRKEIPVWIEAPLR